MPEVETRRVRQLGAVALLAAVLTLALAASARAAQTVFWVNYAASTVSRAPVGGGSGADLPIASGFVAGPYGIAIDSAAGRVYWANFSSSTIAYANLDGSDPHLLDTTGAAVDSPGSLAIDPASGKIFWTNTGTDAIAYANLSGGGGGYVNTAGATLNEPYGVTVDPANGYVYWANYGSGTISRAALDGSGGNDLDSGVAPLNGPDGVAIDSSTGRIYWANYNGGSIGYANLGGGGGGEVATPAALGEPAGVAIDPERQAIFWADEGLEQIGAASLTGGVAPLLATTGATVSEPAFPVILESPRIAEPPAVQGAHRPGSTLACSQGNWQGDLVESFLYRAPNDIAYQWYRNGTAIPGATGAILLATKVGAYSCTVTASNFAGADTGQSATLKVRAKLTLGKVTYNRARGTAKLRLAVTGAGRLALFGRGVANVQRRRLTGTAALTIRATGKARIRLAETGRARVKATVAYTPEGGKAIKRRRTVTLKKLLR